VQVADDLTRAQLPAAAVLFHHAAAELPRIASLGKTIRFRVAKRWLRIIR
jgi:hypothetical protein